MHAIRITDDEGDVIDVVLDAVGVSLDQRQAQGTGRHEVRGGARPLYVEACRKRVHGSVDIVDTESDPVQHARIPRPVPREQRELPSAGVRANQREALVPVDHVHSQMPGQERGERIPVLDPERDVIQRLDLHGLRVPIATREETRSVYPTRVTSSRHD